MKIIILTNNGSGLYNFRREVLEKLVETHTLYACIPIEEYTEELKKLGVQLIDCPYLDRHGKNPFKDLKLLQYYISVLKKISPDIILTYTIKSNVYGGFAASKLGIPFIVNITGLGTAVEYSGFMQKITLFLYKRAMKKAKTIFFQNVGNLEFMQKHGIAKNNAILLPGSGVNLQRYYYIPYKEVDGVVKFAYIGRIMKEKGIEYYINTAKYITSKYSNVEFHIFGSYEQDYKEVIEQLHRDKIVIFHGVSNNMNDVYRDMSCIIHPSYYPEGMSNVLLEACASGRPVITTNRGGCRESVDDGVNGYICNVNDGPDLIDKVERFLALSCEERKNMGKAGRKKMEVEFDRNVVVEKYMAEVEAVRKGGL
jgi:galacturonosyltransferase